MVKGLVFYSIVGILSTFLIFGPSNRTQDEDCGRGFVRAYEDGRFVCTLEEKTVAVYESRCIEKIEVLRGSKVFVDLNEDEINPSNWTSQGLKLTLKQGCDPHYEKVKIK